MESFCHKMFILSQPVPLTGTGVLYPRVRDFLTLVCLVLIRAKQFSENSLTYSTQLKPTFPTQP